MTIIVAILVFAVIVVVHEFGHFAIAKLSGIKVDEFAVGMGPKILGVEKGETLYSLRALPIGGYCKMTGEDEASVDERAFNNKPILNRLGVVFFGPLMNLVLAILIFSLVIIQVPLISEAMPDKPAQKAGMMKGDKIVKINETQIQTWEQVKDIISKGEGTQLNIMVENNGKIRNLQITPVVEQGSQDAIIGIRPSFKVSGLSLTEGVKTTFNITLSMLDYLVQLIFGKTSTQDLVGPVGIIVYLNEAAKSGIIQIIYFTAILSLNLAIINLLPLPALDGGRIIFLLLEGIRKKPVNPEKEGFVHFIGFVMLMVLSLVIAYRDLIKFNIFNLFTTLHKRLTLDSSNQHSLHKIFLCKRISHNYRQCSNYNACIFNGNRYGSLSPGQ